MRRECASGAIERAWVNKSYSDEQPGAMLRFGSRDAKLEAIASAAGYPIIIPRSGRATEKFTIELRAEVDWDEFTDAIRRWVDEIERLFSTAAARKQVAAAAAELDIGLFADRFQHAPLYVVLRTSSTDVRRLAALGVSYAITVYS